MADRRVSLTNLTQIGPPKERRVTREKTVALQAVLCVFGSVLLSKAQGQGLDQAGVIVPDTTVEHRSPDGAQSKGQR